MVPAMSNSQIVQQCYDFFRRGDGPGLLALFDPNIEFRLSENHPYRVDGKPWTGPEEIAQQFLMRAAADWENWDIHVIAMIEATGAVIVEGRYAGIYKPTGRTMDAQVCHVWRLNGGKVTSFHQYVDTAGLQAVMAK